jgi:hypothetical protein
MIVAVARKLAIARFVELGLVRVRSSTRAKKRNSAEQITEVCHRKYWPYVKHYYFHIIDRDWGHVTIRMCGYPPFGAGLILNGHEWVEREARRKCLTAVKDGNCFVEAVILPRSTVWRHDCITEPSVVCASFRQGWTCAAH